MTPGTAMKCMTHKTFLIGASKTLEGMFYVNTVAFYV